MTRRARDPSFFRECSILVKPEMATDTKREKRERRRRTRAMAVNLKLRVTRKARDLGVVRFIQGKRALNDKWVKH